MTSTQMGRRLKALRTSRDLSRQQLAAKAGISREYVRKLEAGAQDPTLGVLTRLAKALGVTLVDLVKQERPSGRLVTDRRAEDPMPRPMRKDVSDERDRV